VIANPDRHCGVRRYAGTGIGSSIASQRSATVGMVVYSMPFIGNRPGSNRRVRGDVISHFERLPPRAVKRHVAEHVARAHEPPVGDLEAHPHHPRRSVERAAWGLA
jgi:hypothetical protein